MPDNPSHPAPLRELTAADRAFIAAAAAYIERPSFLMRLANLVGKPIEAAIGALPSRVNDIVSHATSATLETALHWAIRSLPERTPSAIAQTADAKIAAATGIAPHAEATAAAMTSSSDEPPEPNDSITPEPNRLIAPTKPPTPSDAEASVVSHAKPAGKLEKLGWLSLSPRVHTMMAATSGAVGGLFGLGGLAFEAPATTAVMLRSIAATAARQGADLDDPATRLQCLAVLSLGAPAAQEMDSAYFTARLGMALAVRESAQFIARHNAAEVAAAVAHGTAPSLVRLMGMIAARFQIVLTEKVAAQVVPIAGAVAGAMINAAFTDHFNTVANDHFGILRLERACGAAVVHAVYEDARSGKPAR